MIWITQTDGSSCRLAVAANAALMLGRKPPNPYQDPAWWAQLVALPSAVAEAELMVAAIRYRHSWSVKDLIAPTALQIRDPKVGLHWVLVAEVDKETVGLVGFEQRAATVRFTEAEVEAMLFPDGHINRKADLFVPSSFDVATLTEIAGRIKTSRTAWEPRDDFWDERSWSEIHTKGSRDETGNRGDRT